MKEKYISRSADIAARRSNGVVRWLVRWHTMRARLARNSSGELAKAQPEPVECA